MVANLNFSIKLSSASLKLPLTIHADSYPLQYYAIETRKTGGLYTNKTEHC